MHYNKIYKYLTEDPNSDLLRRYLWQEKQFPKSQLRSRKKNDGFYFIIVIFFAFYYYSFASHCIAYDVQFAEREIEIWELVILQARNCLLLLHNVS